MMSTRVMKCTCQHEYQDKQYGPGQRVHNQAIREGKTSWRCTVCGDVKEASLVVMKVKDES